MMPPCVECRIGGEWRARGRAGVRAGVRGRIIRVELGAGSGAGQRLGPSGGTRKVKADELHQVLMEETIMTASSPFRTSSTMPRARATVSRLGRCYMG